MPSALDPPRPVGVETEGTQASSGAKVADPAAAEAPVAEGSAPGISGRPPLHERLLDAEELDQLQVLRGAVEPSAPIYAAILSVLVAAKERYQVEVRTDQLAVELSEAGHDVTHLAQQLAQLEDWGAVTWTQNTNRVGAGCDDRRHTRGQVGLVGRASLDLATLGLKVPCSTR